MKIETASQGTKLRIYLSGELDHHGARSAMRTIEDRISAYLPRDCVLDLGGLSFMDSSGIAVLLKSYKRLGQIGGRLRVENVPEQPMKVIDASGIERLLGVSCLSRPGDAARDNK
ncbi:MAG: anti-sigma factor antagonist [Oscillospiraceae bacterium]|nr:anti-sigma factor antagonist [Oscillospiraceae bacterium]